MRASKIAQIMKQILQNVYTEYDETEYMYN